MKQIVYTYQSLGGYQPDQPAEFGADDRLKLMVEPHSYEMKLSGEVLQSSQCDGYVIEASRNGAVTFYNWENKRLTSVAQTEKEYVQIRLQWKQDGLILCFGRMHTVDYYPNCDGEYDRWGTEWVTEYAVRLNTLTNQAEICTDEE